MDRSRTAVARMIEAIAWDVSQVPESHPSRTKDEMLGMQISDLVEVADQHLKGLPSIPLCCSYQ